MADRSVAAKQCRYKTRCGNANCSFQHPPGAVRRVIACRYGDDCNNRDCGFYHRQPAAASAAVLAPAPATTPAQRKPCRYGAGCKRDNCPFRHPVFGPKIAQLGSGASRLSRAMINLAIVVSTSSGDTRAALERLTDKINHAVGQLLLMVEPNSDGSYVCE